MNAERLLKVYEQISEAPDAIARLRRFVLDLAVRGKLVEQDAGDEPADVLLQAIASEKASLVERGALKADRKPRKNPTPVELFELPLGWSWANLQSICLTVTDGDHQPPPRADEGVPFLVIGDVRNKTINYDVERMVSREYYDGLDPIRKPRSGDLLYTLVGSFGIPVPVRSDAPFCVQRHIGILRPAKQFSLSALAIFLESEFAFKQAEAAATGIAQKTVSLAGLRGMTLPIPPLAEQHRIVAKVDELMALCDRLEKARKTREEVRDKLTAASLARLTAPDTTAEDFPAHAAFALEALPALTTRPDQIGALRQTILNLAVRGKLVEQDQGDERAVAALERISEVREAASARKSKRARGLATLPDEETSSLPDGWKSVRLSDIAVSMRYGTSTKCGADSSLVPVLRIPNVSSGRVTLDGMKFGPLSEKEQHDLALEQGDLLMIRSNGSLDIVGRSAVVPKEAVGMAFAGYLVRLRTVPDHLNTSYVWLAMNSQMVRDQIEKPIRSAVGLKNVNLTEFGNLSFWLPPLAEQHRIVAKVDVLMALCDRLEAALTTADTTRTRLLEALLYKALEPATEVLEAAE